MYSRYGTRSKGQWTCSFIGGTRPHLPTFVIRLDSSSTLDPKTLLQLSAHLNRFQYLFPFMAQPPPPPPPPRQPITGQRFLELILDRDQHEITTMLLRNLNLRDYMILRTRLNSQILGTLDPEDLLSQNRAPWAPPTAAPAAGGAPNPQLAAPAAGATANPQPAAPAAGPTANPDPNATDYLRRNLGARCDDNRFIIAAPIVAHPRCPNGIFSMVRMEACKHPNPPGNPPRHAPFPTGTFNVCDQCVGLGRAFTRLQVHRRIPARRAILCKSHSLSVRRRAQQNAQIPGCSCARAIVAGHKCSACRLHTEMSTYRVGDARRNVLMRTHISYKEKGRKGRKTLVVRPDIARNIRARPACPEPGCGKKAWIRHPTHPPQGPNEPDLWKHADAAVMCLCCNQIV